MPATAKAEHIELSIANATPKDAQFFRALTALFTDPAHADWLAGVRKGELVLGYNPKDGALQVISELTSKLTEQRN